MAKGSSLNASTSNIPATGAAGVNTSGIQIPLLVNQALLVKRYQSSIWDGANSASLYVREPGKIQVQFSPFGLTNALAEYQGAPFITTYPGPSGILMDPAMGEFSTLIDDWYEYDDYPSQQLTRGIQLQSFWVCNNLAGAIHAANWSEIAAWEIWELPNVAIGDP